MVVKGTGVAHKSEGGLVATGLRTDQEVHDAASGILGKGCSSLLVARHESGGVELLLGVSTDDVFGPVIVVGAAASPPRRPVMSPAPSCRSPRPQRNGCCPAWRIAASCSAAGAASRTANRAALVEMIMRLAALAAEGEIAELDINPLLARPDGVIGLDALVRLA